MDKINVLEQYAGFQWDPANETKNWVSHQVSCVECEEIFFNEPILLLEDSKHSQQEARCYALGKTDNHRKLLVVFTIRNNLIRVISARDMSKKERGVYEQAEKNSKI